MNKEIELLNKKLEAQDKIINTQALEIAKLNKQLENENKVVEEYLKLENKIDKAIEYIKKDTRWFDYEYAKTYGELCTCKGANSNRLEVMVNPSNLLKILGDKE